MSNDRLYKLEHRQPHSFIKGGNINLASSQLTRKKRPPDGGYVFQPSGIIFELVQDIIGKNLLTKFHKDRIINVVSRVYTMKNAPPPVGDVFQATATIFKLILDIIGTNFLTKFHENRKINLAIDIVRRKTHDGQMAITKDHHQHIILKRATSPFLSSFKLIQTIIGTNVLTNFHEDLVSLLSEKKTAPCPGGHVFQGSLTIIEMGRDIIRTMLRAKFLKI
ncbi:hypothetical protein DPMN_075603 [Dreissena polymorpha]|uniref:Uncharacterized protein n=1 Tax=Dreissena polymorpha TaxID=45954 RepID=A0A9D3YIF6_DREPO|nr:hypothetical protein DPMN_075603 [Dreissena polymorpha]